MINMNRTFTMFCKESNSDDSFLYDLFIHGKPCVGEVVTEILKNNDNWGTIRVYSKSRDAWVTSMRFEAPNKVNTLDPGYNNHIVTKGHATGGWGQMDYYLYIN